MVADPCHYKIKRRCWNSLCFAIHLIIINGRASHHGEDPTKTSSFGSIICNYHFIQWQTFELGYFNCHNHSKGSDKRQLLRSPSLLIRLLGRWVSKPSPSKRQTPKVVQITFFWSLDTLFKSGTSIGVSIGSWKGQSPRPAPTHQVYATRKH